ncbi:alpha/beta hydrolase [Nocardioides solisilvae]|uniref:alpha/beta hydrolase n=1 Tax=Nocardioides solisilvae TaxID=1542435 RepID=UPI000D7463AC|nr:alpha/beta hydrolase [Nocardioides solisilvae]
MSFLRRQLVTAALTANALRPPRGFRRGVGAFPAGWLTGELAPHLLAWTVVDAAAHLARRRTTGDRVALALAAASTLGLARLVQLGGRTREEVEAALVEGLGVDYVEQLDAPPTPADLAVPWRSVLTPFRMGDVRVRVERDIPYVEGGRRGHLDVYRPVEPHDLRGAPVLVQVHGGGWTVGRKDQQGVPLMQHMAAKGWVCVAVNYRLAPRHPFPTQLVDVKRALAWVHEHVAEHGGDPAYVVVTGGSAGGHLAAMAALTPGDARYQPGFEEADTSVRAAVPVYGVYDFAGATGLRSVELMRDLFLAPRVLRKRFRDDPEAFEAASPILRITPEAPDFLVVHGRDDSLVDVRQARAFVAALRRESRASVVYAELTGAQHAFDVFHSIRSAHVVRAVERYLSWHWNRYRLGLPVEAS